MMSYTAGCDEWRDRAGAAEQELDKLAAAHNKVLAWLRDPAKGGPVRRVEDVLAKLNEAPA